LFNDDFLIALSEAKVGCFIGFQYVDAIANADDIVGCTSCQLCGKCWQSMMNMLITFAFRLMLERRNV